MRLPVKAFRIETNPGIVDLIVMKSIIGGFRFGVLSLFRELKQFVTYLTAADDVLSCTVDSLFSPALLSERKRIIFFYVLRSEINLILSKEK